MNARRMKIWTRITNWTERDENINKTGHLHIFTFAIQPFMRDAIVCALNVKINLDNLYDWICIEFGFYSQNFIRSLLLWVLRCEYIAFARKWAMNETHSRMRAEKGIIVIYCYPQYDTINVHREAFGTAIRTLTNALTWSGMFSKTVIGISIMNLAVDKIRSKM